MPSLLGVAIDGGARATLRALARWEELALDESGSASPTYWNERFHRADFRMLIVGTSDSSEGSAIETAARLSAAERGVKIVAIEDFPGNFVALRASPTDLLVVENGAVRESSLRRWGSLCPPMATYPAVRYDPLRRAYPGLRQFVATRRLAFDTRPRILWAGQPETQDCLSTLEALAPTLARLRALLLLKAHPRDPGHREGAYDRLRTVLGLDVFDLTGNTTDEAMAQAPDLVVTQFSSLAVEAGFYGVPAMLALFPGRGGKSLKRKGYDIPPWCMFGAALHVTDPGSCEKALDDALNDSTIRARIIPAFDRYFAVDEESAQSLIRHLQTL